MSLLLAVPDKFRGTATAPEVAAAMAEAAGRAGWTAEALPLSDGGEGLLDCFGGANRTTTVSGPLATPVEAAWRLDGASAVLEMARASGIALVDGANDPVRATTRGTGELIAAAIEAGAREIVLGAGGSATTDGGSGAVEVLRPFAPLDGTRGVQVVVAADVTTRFLDAAAVFGPQKGADPATVAALTERLHLLAARYEDEFGVDVVDLPGGGAAGGLGGGLAALGAAIRPGFGVVAEVLGLPERLRTADLVVTGEGRFDATSRAGKATGSVLELARVLGRPAALVAGQIEAEVPAGVAAVDLTARFGAAARSATLECVRTAVAGLLAG